MLITHVLIITKYFLIHIIAAGFLLIGLKISHLELGLFNYSWIRHCGAALKARFLSCLVVVSSRMVNQALAQSPELVISASEGVQSHLQTHFCVTPSFSQTVCGLVFCLF